MLTGPGSRGVTLRFSANLGFLWSELPLLERIDAAAAAGFKAVELHWPYDTPAAAVRARLELHGLALISINTARGDVAAGENGLGAVSGREQAFQDAVDQALAYCAAAGGQAVHCLAGIVPPERCDLARTVLLGNMEVAAAKAARQGLTLLLEPLNPRDAPDYFYATPDQGADIVNTLGRNNVRLMFDCYHAGMTGTDVIDGLERLLPLIGHVQIAAVPSRAEPDGGTLDFRGVFAALERLAYAGWVGCEYRPKASTDAGLGWTGALGVEL